MIHPEKAETPQHGAAGSLREPGSCLGVWLLLGVHAGLLVWSSLRQAPTVDEPVHLASGIRRLEEGRFDLNRGNPPLVGTLAAVPLLLVDHRTDWSRVPNSHSVGRDFLAVNGPRSFLLVRLGRWVCIPFSLLGGYVCFRWASELYGRGAGFVALILWCSCPNMIAHGPLITGDMAATALGLTAFYAFWRWLRAPSVEWAVMAGAFLGLAGLTKYVWVLLFLWWPVLWILWRWLHRHAPARPSKLKEIGHGLLILALSVTVIGAGYLFDGMFLPLDRFQVGKRVLQPLAHVPYLASWLASLPVPLPAEYLTGLDEIRQFLDATPFSYLGGKWLAGGVWYAYPYAMAVKVPLGTLSLFALAAFLSLRRRHPRAGKTELLLLLTAAAMLVFVTWSHAVQNLRYVLPVLPLGFLFAGKTARLLVGPRRIPGRLVAACLGWSIASSLMIYPHSLSYFNELAGGPRNGDRCLVECNIDWGQDLLFLKDWLDEHPEARPLHLAYFGRINPAFAGIADYSLPPAFGPEQPPELCPWHGPEWHAISINLTRGLGWEVPTPSGASPWVGGSKYQYYLPFSPVATAGYSIRIYHIDCAQANQVRKELNLRACLCEDDVP